MRGLYAVDLTPVLTDAVIEEVLLACGGGRWVIVGMGVSRCVRAALRLGIDAWGVEASGTEAVEWAQATMPGRVVAGTVQALPYADGFAETLVVLRALEHLQDEEVQGAISEMSRVASRALYLRTAVHSVPGDAGLSRSRGWWEQRLFSTGFRKHPSYYRVNAYEALERDEGEMTLVVERLPALAWVRYPLAALAAERDLHMDMLRETGPRSDAHVARYQWASAFVRPGDIVLDAACGLGYGSYYMQTGTQAARTLGIDGSAYAINYARENYAAVVPGLEFREGFLPGVLAQIPDHSVDVVVSFETLEHVEDNLALLAEFHRVLTPAGRIVVSVPNDWSDETGEDPNPFHVHVYTLDRLRRELRGHFILEKLVAQSASQHKSGLERKLWTAAGRSLREVPPAVAEHQAPDAEWWLAVAMRSPLEGHDVPYRETQFPLLPSPDWNVTAFGRDYQNPWLVRGMVDITHRIQDRRALHTLAEKVFETAAADSADAGAALCVLAYQLAESEETSSADVEALYLRVTAYLRADPCNPHAQRWCVSLQFVLGRLWMGVGNFTRATEALEGCVAWGTDRFSPLLENRVVEACLILGQLNLHRKQRDAALRWWMTGIERARSAVAGDWKSAIGNPARPVEFGLPELGTILEYASACAYGLVHIDDVETKPWWWLHPRRDRLSRHAATLRQAKNLEQRLDASNRETAAYRKQSDAYREQLERSVDAARQSAAYSEQLAAELENYQGQSDVYRQQIEAAQTTTQELSSYADRLLREVVALKAESEEYARNFHKAQIANADAMAYSERLAAELENYQGQSDVYRQQIEAAQTTTQELSSYADRLLREVVALKAESEEYARNFHKAQTATEDAVANRAKAEYALLESQGVSVLLERRLVETEARLNEADKLVSSLRDEVSAYCHQSVRYSDQILAAETQLQEGAAYARTLENELKAYENQAAVYEASLQAHQEQARSKVEALENRIECLEQERNRIQVEYRSMQYLHSERMASLRFLFRQLWHATLVRAGLSPRRES